MDHLKTTIDSIRNLRKWVYFNEQFLPAVIEHKRRNDSQFSNLLQQLRGTERVLCHLSSSTLEAHWPLLQELDCVLGRAITLVKEVCFKPKDSTSRREHESEEHHLEVFLDLRWWTWVLIYTAPLRTASHGERFLGTPKGVLDLSSSGLPSFMQKLYLWWSSSDGYARHLPSYGIEVFVQETEGLSSLVAWLKTESEKPLDKFDTTRDIRSAGAGAFIIEGKVLVPVLTARKPSWVGDELKVDLTQVVLGMSSSGLVIKYKHSGTEYALKRVQNLDQRQPVTARLCHPHIVQLMSYWRENSFLFLMMEFMEGDFQDLIKRRLRVKKSPFIMNVVLDILLQIAKAMLYLHDMGLTHPHLKSSDVLFKEAAGRSKLDKNDTKYLVKLGDFQFYSQNGFESMAQQNVYQFGLICLEALSTEPLHWELEDRVMRMSEEPKEQFNKIQNRPGYAIPGSLTQCITRCLDGSIKFSKVVVMLLLAQLQVLRRATKETSPRSLDSKHRFAKQQGILSSPGSCSRFAMDTEMSVENTIEQGKAHWSQLTRVTDASDFDGEEVAKVGKGTKAGGEVASVQVGQCSTVETAGHLLSQEGQQKLEFARFLSSLPEDERRVYYLEFDGDSRVKIDFGGFEFILFHGTGVKAGYSEFLEGVASSEITFFEEVIISLEGDDSCKHVEAFAEALRQSHSRFKKLDLRCSNGSAILFANCIMNVLLENDAIQDLSLDFWGLKEEMGKELVGEFMTIIAVPYGFRILKSFRIGASKLDGEGVEELMKPFQDPPYVLETLLFHSLTSNAQLEYISDMLASSTSLKTLHVTKSELQKVLPRGYNSLAVGLCTNQSLEALACDISSSMELKALLDPLISRNNSLQYNTTLTKLCLWNSMGEKKGIETLVDLIRTNTSLLELGLNQESDSYMHDAQGVENVLAILEALKINKSLRRIDFRGCQAVRGYKVLGAMMDLLLENHNIQDIDLTRTGLEKSRDADYVYSALLKRKKMKVWSIVQGMATVNQTSGRVFLCGQPFAGKTRLRMSMMQLKEFQGKVPMKNKPLDRTHGIEVESVPYDGIGITIWDMAGQINYHSFHELMMSNLSADRSSSMILLMCNPMEKSNLSRRFISDIHSEIESWLRFIASNTRRSLSYRPHVSIVMTHFDYWKDDHAFATCIDDEVLQLKSQFQEVLEFDEDKYVFKVDGRDETHARGVFDFIKSHMKQLLERLPKTISACEKVQHLVALWNVDQSKPLLLKWEEFCEGMCKEVEELNDVNHELAERKREFVAISLNDGGHIIYNEKERVVITNPHWFCHQIVGQILHQCSNIDCGLGMVSSDGIISIEHMKYLILKLVEGGGDQEKKFCDLLGMMIELLIWYKHDASSILIPSTLKDKHKSLSWSTNDESTSLRYVGRRLTSQDGIQAMLTSGFFTRLQVFFSKKLENKNDQNTYKVFRDIIKFISDGIDVILQFNQGDIDILLRSHQRQDEMLEFLENKIVMHIKYLQKDPILGCPGVRLIEYILRPACVQNLVHVKDRKSQCVQVKDLEAKVIKIGMGATHNWQSCEGLEIGYDKVSTLLGDLAWKNLLERRSCDLQDYHKKIQSLRTTVQDDHSKLSDEKGDFFGKFWTRSQRLLYGPLDKKLDDILRLQQEQHKEMMSKLDEVVHTIQLLEHSIQNMQKKLLLEVCSKIDDLMAFSLEMQKSQIPKLAYLCEFKKKKLLTQFMSDLDRIQLHLMCESIHGFHKVPNQKGCAVSFGTEQTRIFLTMLAWGFKIATLLTKIGANVVCGMDSMVPGFSDGGTDVALILDTTGFLDYQIPTATLESLPSDVMKDSKISIEDQSKAQRWLLKFLEPKCQNKKDFYKQFGLKKVQYTRVRGSISWICDKCILLHHNDIDELE